MLVEEFSFSTNSSIWICNYRINFADFAIGMKLKSYYQCAIILDTFGNTEQQCQANVNAAEAEEAHLAADYFLIIMWHPYLSLNSKRR